SFKTQPWNARVKDQIENRLHDLVCSGELDLATAQREIASDWIAAYKKYFHTDVPLSQARGRRSGGARVAGERSSISTPPAAGQGAAAPAGQVWVNTRSGVYWRPGTRYYGKTKQGKFMSEADAIKAGYHAARGQ